MNHGQFSELFSSLTLQSSVMLAAAWWLAGRTSNCKTSDRVWSSCHVCILVLVACGFLCPHVRLFSVPPLFVRMMIVSGESHSPSIVSVIVGVWLCGAAVLTLAVTCSLFRGSRLVGDTQPFSTTHLSCHADLLTAGINVRTSEHVATPLCWQFHRPVIVIPRCMVSFPADELNAVLLHEVGHLKAHHPLSVFLQRLTESIFWFHPLVWLTSRRWALQREFVCDSYASRSARGAAVFLRGLLRLTATQPSRLTLPVGLGLIGEQSDIATRVKQLLSTDWESPVSQYDNRLARAAMPVVAVLVSSIWLPTNPMASPHSWWSPWPAASAVALHELGLPVRDYEANSEHIEEMLSRHGTMPNTDR